MQLRMLFCVHRCIVRIRQCLRTISITFVELSCTLGRLPVMSFYSETVLKYGWLFHFVLSSAIAFNEIATGSALSFCFGNLNHMSIACLQAYRDCYSFTIDKQNM